MCLVYSKWNVSDGNERPDWLDIRGNHRTNQLSVRERSSLVLLQLRICRTSLGKQSLQLRLRLITEYLLHSGRCQCKYVLEWGFSLERLISNRSSFTPFCRKFGTPLDGHFKLYINHCHRDAVNIFFINMRNSLFRLLILFHFAPP